MGITLRYRGSPVAVSKPLLRRVLFVAVLVLGLVAASTGCTLQKDTPDAGAAIEPPKEVRGTIGEAETLRDVGVNVLAIDSFDQSPQLFPR